MVSVNVKYLESRKISENRKKRLRGVFQMSLKPKTKYTPTETFSVSKDGFFGMYFEPIENRFPGKGLVICSGSDGSFLLSRLGAERFYEAGIPVLALGYWNVKGTPQDVQDIPVEYMQRACLWLKEKKGLHPAVWGISLGGEYALLCGSLVPEIECVIAASPMHILCQAGSFKGGLHFAKGAPFSLEGKPLPYISVTDQEAAHYLKQVKCAFIKKREADIKYYYDEVLRKPRDPETEIRVEQIRGPVLLISGGADVMLPADFVCRQVVERLKEKNFRYPVVHHNYEVLSHYACPIRPMTSWIFQVERKHKEECNKNRENSFQDTLRFLRDVWKVED